LVLVYSQLETDARVLRQIRWLSQRFKVTSAAFGPSPIEGIEHVELADLPPYRGGALGRLIYAGLYVLGFYSFLTAMNPRNRDARRRLAGREWDVVVANDATALPLALRLRAKGGVLADLHEYSPEGSENTFVNRLTINRYFRSILRRHLKSAAAVVTVGSEIANRYHEEFGVDVRVVANAAPYANLEPTAVGKPIRIVHSAAPDPLRQIEVMIEAVRRTRADVMLDLYLVDDGSSYVRSLRELVADIDRVNIKDAVPYSSLVPTLAWYDVGIHLLPPVNFNQLWALPNKLFDYVQARLGLLIGPSPEMQRLVRQYGLGTVTDDFTVEALTRTLDAIRPADVVKWKGASHRSARTLSGEVQLATFEDIVVEIAARAAPN
jgi:glycosyltransferase involved in cell wall biosynthesis